MLETRRNIKTNKHNVGSNHPNKKAFTQSKFLESNNVSFSISEYKSNSVTVGVAICVAEQIAQHQSHRGTNGL